jgi:DNA-binding CsgD family transcriptional regulator
MEDADNNGELPPSDEPEPVYLPQALTEHERELLRLQAKGLSLNELAQLFFRSPSDTWADLNSIYRKIDVTSTDEAIDYARTHGIYIEPPPPEPEPEIQPPPPDRIPDGLSRREVEVVQLVALGRSDEQIARQLYLSANTVRAHLYSIYSKLGINSRKELIDYAREHGL